MKKVGLGQWILGLVLFLYTIICLLPVILVVIVSFSSDESINKNGFSFFPQQWSLKAWEYVGSFGRQLVNSYAVTILITVGGTVLGLVIMSMFAYTLSRKNFELRGFLSVMMLITMLFSGGLLSSYLVNTTMYHLKDNLLVLILPGTMNVMNVIILRTYIQSNIPDALIESAKIDGARERTIFWKIAAPMMKPALACVGFMMAVGYWNEWQGAMIYITSPSKTPLQLLLVRIENNINFLMQNAGNVPTDVYASMSQNIPQNSGRMAILLTVLGPIMVIYPFFQKYFVKGLTVGSVKG